MSGSLDGSMDRSTMTRRRMLALLGTTMALPLAAACGQATPAAPSESKPAESKPAAAPATQAAAPAAQPAATKPAEAAKPAADAKPAAGAAPAVSKDLKASVELLSTHPEWKDALTGVVKEFQKVYPSIEVNLTAIAGSAYDNQLQTMLNAGTGPDLFQSRSRPRLDILAKSGQILDLTAIADQTDWTPVAKDASIVDGKVWSVPGGKYTVGLAYHVDVLDKAGIKDLPKTWEELTEAFKKLKAGGTIPYAIEAKDGSLTFFNFIGLSSTILGINGFNDVVAGKKKLTDPDIVGVIQQMMDWKDYYQPNFVGTTYQEAKALFATGKVAIMDAGSSDYNGYKQVNPNVNLGFMYWPSGPNGKQATNTGMEFQVSVNAVTKQKDAAMAFVGWLGTRTGAQAMANNVKNLPVLNGVTVEDPLQKLMIATPNDVPVWNERQATVDVRTVWIEKGQGPFTGSLTAADMAKLLQESVDKNIADAKKS
jgi:raffinose/stachyose/melibiose transport system substrate-binding protein